MKIMYLHNFKRNSELSTYVCEKCGKTSITAQQSECFGSAAIREFEEIEETESDK